MPALFTKKILIIACVIALIGLSLFLILVLNKEAPLLVPNEVSVVTPTPIATTTRPAEQKIIESVRHEVIGKSVEGRAIDAYQYGNGSTHLMFVGGIHGGYEWNSVLLAYQFMDYLKANPNVIPKNLTIAIIPSANPDGIYRVTKKEGRFTTSDIPSDQKLLESGRFNANMVDLNRNFDCKWQPKSLWKNRTVSAGTSAFSEPEAAALRDFVSTYSPASVVFWHSMANAVYASKCEAGILPKTIEIMNVYARGSGYTAVKTFDAYETTGDSEGWLASINIPAITVELKNHEDIEWDKNLAGFIAMLKYYNK